MNKYIQQLPVMDKQYDEEESENEDAMSSPVPVCTEGKVRES